MKRIMNVTKTGVNVLTIIAALSFNLVCIMQWLDMLGDKSVSTAALMLMAFVLILLNIVFIALVAPINNDGKYVADNSKY